MKVNRARGQGAGAILGVTSAFLVIARLTMAQDTAPRNNGPAGGLTPSVAVADRSRGISGQSCERRERGWVVIDTSADGLIETAINAKCWRGPGVTVDFRVRFRVIRGPQAGRDSEQTWRIACQVAGGQFQMVGIDVARDEHGQSVKNTRDGPSDLWRGPKAGDRGPWRVLRWACDHVDPARGPS
jgi:hypothetical protein